MRHVPRRSRAAAAVVAVVAATAVGAGCGFPTDKSTGMYVTVSSSQPVLLRGTALDLSASVWLRRGIGDSVDVRNAEILWMTSDSHLATIAGTSPGTGRVTGVNPGMVEIRAIAPGHQGAEPGIFQLRVANPLEIDSLAPDTVRYGEQVTMYGVGVGPLFFAGLGDNMLVPDSFAVAGDPRGLGERRFWVAWPSNSGHVFAAGSGQLVTAPSPTVVLPWDLFEPNENAPTTVALDGPAPFPLVPAVRFYNPALAFEDLRKFPFGFDWYRWTTADPSKPYSFVFIAPAQAGAHLTYLTDSLRPDNAPRNTGWRIGTGLYDCKGYEFRAAQAESDSVVIALRRLPATSVDLVAAYVQEGRYLLAIVEGYVTADPRIAPDRFEENDLCDFADDNFANPLTRIELTREFADTLTIDNAHDVDWLRFRVPGLLPQAVAIRAAALPFTAVDRSDIDLYVFRVPSPTDSLVEVGRDDRHGSASAVTLTLTPGDYYLAVVDSAGVATRYSLCIAAALNCTTPVAAGSPAQTIEVARVPPTPPRAARRMRTGVWPRGGRDR